MFRIVSDVHAGSTVALCPPKISLDDGGEYHASKAQLWLWEKWKDFWEQGERMRRRMDAHCIDVFNGDMTEGDHHKSTQVLSGNPTAQAAVVNEVMKVPLATKPDGIVFIRGTEAHVGPSAAFEERIAIGLKKDGWPVIVDPATGNGSHWHWTFEHQGVRLDFAHHGKFGSRPNTKFNTVIALAFDIFTRAALEHRAYPHLAVRSHMHQYGDTGSLYPTRLIQMPAWQLSTAFIHRINPGALADVGGIIVTIVEGKMEIHPIIYKPDAAKPHTL
tara:strand:+ start:697 stop:1518 length:822 start_codon:yes stop_codon:yes gene_type:complete